MQLQNLLCSSEELLLSQCIASSSNHFMKAGQQHATCLQATDIVMSPLITG